MRKLLIPITAVGLFIASGCHESHEGHEDHDHDHIHVSDKVHSEGEKEEEKSHVSDEIIISPEKAKAAGIETIIIEPSEFSGVIKSSGKVLTASDDETVVVAPSAGIVAIRQGFTEGMSISKGASLFSISSSRLPEGDLIRRNELAYSKSKADLERAEKLKAEKLITESEYLEAKTEYERAKLAYEASGGQKAIGGIAVSAPSGGYVKECLVRDGDFVEVGQPMMRLTRNRKLFLRAELPESDFDKLYTITSAKFRPSYSDRVYDISELDGSLVARGQTSSDNSAFIPITFEFNNTGGIVPGCYAEIYLLTTNRENVISVPLSALTEEQGIHYVYVKVDEEGYVKKEVKLGASDGERVELLAGLTPGEELVSKGAIKVKLASATAAIPAHNHNH